MTFFFDYFLTDRSKLIFAFQIMSSVPSKSSRHHLTREQLALVSSAIGKGPYRSFSASSFDSSNLFDPFDGAEQKVRAMHKSLHCKSLHYFQVHPQSPIHRQFTTSVARVTIEKAFIQRENKRISSTKCSVRGDGTINEEV